ncbi:flagellar basal body L-ring protein FlgH [Amaricoccus sp.]|uniref:flagellar basal body L-ring protein FlgH n=1 Tax=Amaricoccus sp. TaxID=1872485 RepID=UPI00261538B3|nr:flagellar basal body L-ring protein FlgH [Amaricoccus sp.]HRO10638.1 flagellar basal body L-ring protein FlgH [Amaricoccus sp.]
MTRTPLLLAAAVSLAACGMQTIGRPPEMTSIGVTEEDAKPILTAERAAVAVPPPQPARYAYQQGSLWNTGPSGLLGDRRARSLGDILTVTIEIDDKAEMKNTTTRTREGSESADVGAFFGVSNVLPPGVMKLNPTLEMESESDFTGTGSIKRNEKLELRVAATVVQVLPNGHLVIQGDQEVRVNYELRDLQVTGIVRPEDISRYNEIPYDRIAGARISYGGRGQVSSAQQPRYGQQVVDRVVPY